MKKILVVFLLIFLVSCSARNVVELNGIKIDVEIANTDEARQQGLMFRNSLEENEGMLFVFDNEEKREFWMKNTFIPLDIIFLDKNMQVVSIIESMEPCKEANCPTYSSKVPATYALEVNAGFVKENNINEGMVAKLWQ